MIIRWLTWASQEERNNVWLIVIGMRSHNQISDGRFEDKMWVPPDYRLTVRYVN